MHHNSGISQVLFIQVQEMGIDWNGPLPSMNDAVDVDPPSEPLSSSEYQELCGKVNPLDPSSEYGIETYFETLQFVLSKLHAQ